MIYDYNLDTSTLVMLVSEDESRHRKEISILLEGNTVIVTKTALREFSHILETTGGLIEKQNTMRLLQTLIIVEDNPSDRFKCLSPSKSMGKNDLVIFGTGDFYGITTITADMRFIRGCVFNIYIKGPMRKLILSQIKETGSAKDFSVHCHETCPLIGK